MTTPAPVKDLIVLAADKQMQRTIETLLNHRSESLRIANLSADVLRHPKKDPGCRTAARGILTPLRNEYRKAMVMFDFHGCGERNRTATQLEVYLEQELANAGWGHERIAVIVIEPELEAWIFGSSFAHLQHAVRWSQSQPIREWLEARDYLSPHNAKPQDPKAAIESVLVAQKKPLSSSLFADLASVVSLAQCQDRAFQKFRTILQGWFPAG